MMECSALATRILVVDDDVRTARLLARMLREDGFEAEFAPDGATAIGRLAHHPMPDVLVTDLRMPHASGVTVARYARSREATLPIVMITGYPDQMGRYQELLSPPL